MKPVTPFLWKVFNKDLIIGKLFNEFESYFKIRKF